jgi:Lon protease-like protein
VVLIPIVAFVLLSRADGAFLRLNGASRSRRISRTTAFGLSEWRDTFFDTPGSTTTSIATSSPQPPVKQICLLPFPYTEVLLQGETKQLRLYEERFIKLFQNVMTNHSGVVGMALFANGGSGIIQTVPLCEIEDYNSQLLNDGFGIFVTIRVVSRASLLSIHQQAPYMQGTCTEVLDQIPPSLDLPNLLADDIETSIFAIQSMEFQLDQQQAKADPDETTINQSSSSSSVSNATAGSASDDMDQRILAARLVRIPVLYIVLPRHP